MYVALSEKLEEAGGSFIHNCRVIPHNPQAVDESLQQKLWEMSCKLTKLNGSLSKTTIIPDPFLIVDVEV